MIIKYFSFLLLSVFLIPLIQTANAQSILDQIGGAFNNLTSPGGQSQYSITGQDAFSPNVNTTPSGQSPSGTSGTTAGQAGQSPSGTNTQAGAGASDGRQDLASPAGEKAFEEGLSTADQAGQAPLIARQTSNNTGGQFESTLKKPAGMAGVIQDTPNYDKVVPNAGETTSNAVIQANQSENNVQTSTAKYPSNGSRPSVSGLTDVRPSEYMNYTSELNKANIGGNDTPKLATTIGDAFKDTSKTIGDAVGNIIPK